ncbi:MAG TPA: hypothetical protein VNU01_03885 [Egibacteraceae bacterium]|nr:hypothetical protein [Egibacteraceae bacterium]
MRDSPLGLVGAYAAAALVVSAVRPSLAAVLLEITVLALIGLSLDVALRRVGAPALLQPGAVAAGAWATAALLGRNQSPVIALAAAALAGAVAGLAVLGGHPGGPVGLVFAGIAVAILATAIVPPAPGFVPPVFLGVSLASSRATLGVALLALAAGAALYRATVDGDLGRWLGIARRTPDLVTRVGVSLPAVLGSGLALSGMLAGLAAWAAALGTLGVPAMRPIDPGVGLAWLLIPLAGGGGVAGALGGAAVFAAVTKIAAAAGVPALAIAGPLVAVLWWRGAAR